MWAPGRGKGRRCGAIQGAHYKKDEPVGRSAGIADRQEGERSGIEAETEAEGEEHENAQARGRCAGRVGGARGAGCAD
jgi:hypothetical protein